LGITIVGGLIMSQALTMFTTPVVYLYLDRVSNWWRGKHPKKVTPGMLPETAPG
jgi:HAE1 family hydrophobic/amphiphilic exporter-1